MLAAAALFWISYRLAPRRRFHTAAVQLRSRPSDSRVCRRRSRAASLGRAIPCARRKEPDCEPARADAAPNPVLDYDFRNWGSNHVWLHKPPLAFWMQAASMRVFGVSEWPMRLPSLLVSTLSVLTTYAIGYLLISPPVGLVAAAFHAVHGFSVDLSAGRRATDHVDTLLIFIVETGLLLALLAPRKRPRAAGAVLGVALASHISRNRFLLCSCFRSGPRCGCPRHERATS